MEAARLLINIAKNCEPEGTVGGLHAQIREVHALGAEDKGDMYALFSQYYDSVSEGAFLADLSDKNHVFLLSDRSGQLQGFSTLAVLSHEHNGVARRAIFSGDTIIHHEHWGEHALAFTWIRFAGHIKAQHPRTPLDWFLIVKGHRTYRYLPVFSLRYYPAWSHPTPPETKAWMDRLAHMRFGEHYDPVSGVLRFPSSRGQLRGDWAKVSEEDCRRPEVRFFLERNPGYTRGHELVCLTELHEDNLKPLARRLFLQGMNV
jgi:hypothetical protein